VKKRVLILCTGNSARSQMAEGLLRHMAGHRFEVASAGTKPSVVRPEAIQAMQEIGISLEGHRSKSVDEFVGKPIDYVITVCDNAKESCPIFPTQTSRMHWPFQDPPGPIEGTYEQRLAVFRMVRDRIRERLAHELQSGVFASPVSEVSAARERG
jgi:arsenate reductase (thioredoxin)